VTDRVTARTSIVRVRGDQLQRTRDTVAAEEPMEIRVNGDAVAVTMRTPGDDFALALGFCLTEGIVAGHADVGQIRYCAGKDPETGRNLFNVVDLALRDPTPVPLDLRRNVFTSSSCGICGTASIDAVRKRLEPVGGDEVRVSVATLSSLPDRLREAQAVFEKTGGLHAAALFTAEGELVALREDVGRHNAVDKVVGWAAIEGLLPLTGHVLMVSGRVAFEIAQKALYARIPVVAAVSAPSSLAVGLAEESGMTLVGFLRGDRMNIYTAEHRVVSAEASVT
jgi:FdhD protein